MLTLLHRALKWVAVAAILLVAAGMAAPYIRADFFRSRIHSELQKALGRNVEMGRVRYNLFTGPGFTVDDVLIAEDSRIGIEPFAHVPEMSVSVSPLSLLTGSLAISSLRLVEPSMNVARSADGVWNVQLFLDRQERKDLPELLIRSGRINFKAADRKHVIYFGNVDADVLAGSSQVRFNLSGEPFRTDRSAVHVGVFGVRGVWDRTGSGEGRFDGEVEMERTGMAELVRLFGGRDPGLRGFVSSEARLSGPLANLKISGKLRLDDLSDRLFRPGLSASAMNYTGELDLPGQRIRLTSGDASGNLPLAAQLEAGSFLADPEWKAELQFRDLGAPAILDAVRQIGFEIPEGIATVGGKLRGDVLFSRREGVRGELAVTEPEIRIAGGANLSDRQIDFRLTGDAIDLKVKTEAPAEIAAGSARAGAATGPAATSSTATPGTATPGPPATGPAATPGPAPASQHVAGRIEGRYDLTERLLEVHLLERAGKIAELKSMAPDVPLLHQFDQGVWRGALSFRRIPGKPDEWQGQIDVADAVARFTGLSDPAVLSFSASLEPSRATVRGIRGKIGKVPFTGDYRFDQSAPRPHRVNLVMERASIDEIERLLKPSLERARGLLSRLTFAKTAEPEWFAQRRVDGTLRIGSLSVGKMTWNAVTAKLEWSGASARLSNISASWGEASLTGDLQMDLGASRPRYAISAAIGNLAYRGGTISLDGKLTTEGLGTAVVSNATGAGQFSAEHLQFSPETSFDQAEGEYEFSVEGQRPKMKLANLKIHQAGDSLLGQGATQPDGKLLLELTTSGRRQLRMIGSLTPATLEPSATYSPESVR